MKNKYKIYTGEKLTEEMYLKTWALDNRTFEKKDRITKELALMWFYASKKSTIVLWDEENNSLVGYLTPFLLTHEFAQQYILSNANYKEAITKDVFANAGKNISADIYIFSTVIIPKYRGIKLEENNKNSKMYNKTAFKVLNEAMVEWICDVKKKGVSINYVFAEKVSDDGEKYLRSLGMQPCFQLEEDDCKFAKLFTPTMFNKCSNVGKLYDLYSIDKICKKFDQKLLENHEYLSVKNNQLYYKDINLYELAKNYNSPLEVAYTPKIIEQVNTLKNLFAEKIKKYKYGGSYKYAYATKANYYSEVILSALNSVDMLETSSAYDIEIMLKLAKLGYIKKGFTVLCNGFKHEKFITVFKKLLDRGINVIPIIENEREFELLKQLSNYKISVGLRYNSDFESRLIKNSFEQEEEFDNRFGFDKDQLFDMAKKIMATSNLTLKVFHFHFGGTITSISNYIKGYSNILNHYCELKKICPSLEYFDFGGGFPVKYSLTYKFNYDHLVDEMVKNAKAICKKNKVKEPILIGEHGRFTTADHSFYIYKIDFQKHYNNRSWYIINGSIMNLTPDVWGIQQDFTILPVNLYENDCIPVCLGGETCDPDDRYYLHDNNVKMFMPKINEGQELYIAIFGIGAYQEIISGIGGLHHCLIPEGNELIIYEQNGQTKYCKRQEITNAKKIFNILDFNDGKYIKKFFKK